MKMKFDYKKNTVLDILHQGIEQYGERVFLRYRSPDGWHEISWQKFGEDTEALASFLLNEGISKEDIVSIYSANRPEWAISDFAILSCGARDATIYPTNYK